MLFKLTSLKSISKNKRNICLFFLFLSVSSYAQNIPNLLNVKMIGGDYAVCLTYDLPMEITNFNPDNFYIKATVTNPANTSATEEQIFKSSYAYIDANNTNTVIVTFRRRVVDWIDWAICYEAKNINIYYSGSFIQSTQTASAPSINGIIPDQMHIYEHNDPSAVKPNPGSDYYHYGRERSDLYVEGVPVNTGYENLMWANNYITGSGITKTIYVNTNSSKANDSNAGTSENTPLKTISAAVGKITQGTRILIYPGIYREKLDINNISGNANTPIVIEGISSNDSVIISGAYEWNENWTINDGGISSSPFNGYNQVEAKSGLSELGKHRENLFVDGVKYEQVLTLNELQQSKDGFYCVTDGNIHVKFPKGFDPENHLIEMNHADGVVFQANECSYIVFRNLHFTKTGNSVNESNSQDNTILNSMEYISHILMEGCSFTYSNNVGLSTRGNNLVFRNCSFSNNGGTGLMFNHNGLTNWGVETNQVNYNIVVEGVNAIGNNWRMGGYGGIMAESTGGITSGTMLNGVLRSVRIEDNIAPGIWMDIHHSNIVIENSTFMRNVTDALWLEIGHGNYLVRNNTFEGNRNALTLGHSQNATITGNLFAENTDMSIGFAWLGGDGDSREQCHKTVDIEFAKNFVIGGNNRITYFPLELRQNDFDTWNFQSFYDTGNFHYNYYSSSLSHPFCGREMLSNFSFNEWKTMFSSGNGEKQSIFSSESLLEKDKNGNWSNSSELSGELARTWSFPVLTASKSGAVSISNLKSETDYYYTTDGFLPTSGSNKYDGEDIVLKDKQTLLFRAISTTDSENYSPILSYTMSIENLLSDGPARLPLNAGGSATPIYYKDVSIKYSAPYSVMNLATDNFSTNSYLGYEITFAKPLPTDKLCVNFHGWGDAPADEMYSIPQQTTVLKGSFNASSVGDGNFNFTNNPRSFFWLQILNESSISVDVESAYLIGIDGQKTALPFVPFENVTFIPYGGAFYANALEDIIWPDASNYSHYSAIMAVMDSVPTDNWGFHTGNGQWYKELMSTNNQSTFISLSDANYNNQCWSLFNTAEKTSTLYINSLYLLEDGESMYVRQIKEGEYGTICLSQAASYRNATLYTVKGIDNPSNPTKLYISEYSGIMKAGESYIYKADSDVSNIIFYMIGDSTTPTVSNGLTGTTEPTIVTENNAILSENQWHYLVGEYTLGEKQAYLDISNTPVLSGTVDYPYITFGNPYTSITNVNVDESEAPFVDVYSILGIKIRSNVEKSKATRGLASGIYIVGSKKLLVK